MNKPIQPRKGGASSILHQADQKLNICPILRSAFACAGVKTKRARGELNFKQRPLRPHRRFRELLGLFCRSGEQAMAARSLLFHIC